MSANPVQNFSRRNIPPLIKWPLIVVAVGYCVLMLILPLAVIFYEALAQGVLAYFKSFQDPAGQTAMLVTVVTTLVAVPLNMVFGIAAAWAIAKFDFPGKSLLITLIDLPFGISPIISGMLFVMLFGSQSWLGPWLMERGIQIIFAWPGILLTTIFVTFPYVARELIPLMQEQGSDEEQAAISLGANGWQTFWRITLPNIRWGLLYGVILCTARALGEFGAVAVVAANVRGKTNTITLHIENLYNDYKIVAAFAMASVLALAGMATLVIKSWIEHKLRPQHSPLELKTAEA
ncbi:MAG: sulfate ABC transporter permease subunit CysW [Pirellulales bacterium]|nr:sulfate ABC transporter permease subunit CysW [Pirellulales bacterium]